MLAWFLLKEMPARKDAPLDKAGFIHAADIMVPGPDGYELVPQPIQGIDTLVREGQMLVVQVQKEPIASKGARLTTFLSVASRYLVCMPHNRHLGISQRIENEQERERLLTAVARGDGERDWAALTRVSAVDAGLET